MAFVEADPLTHLSLLVQVAEVVYHVTGELQVEDGASFLLCSVNGVKSRPKLVVLENTVHLFSAVLPNHKHTLRTGKIIFMAPLEFHTYF